MPELKRVRDCPDDLAWWSNRRCGRLLVCPSGHAEITVLVRCVQAFCWRCSRECLVKTAPASTAGRLTGAA